MTTPLSIRADTWPLPHDSCRDTECYPFIAVIISLSPATKVSALPRLDDVNTLNVALLNVTCSPDTVAVACAVTTDVLLPAVEPDTVCVPSDVGIMACCPRPKAMITTARFLRPGTVTVPFKVITGLAKTRDTECYRLTSPTMPLTLRFVDVA